MSRRRWWAARVFVTGQWCDFGSYRPRGAALLAARTAWDELARHQCRPHFVLVDETHGRPA